MHSDVKNGFLHAPVREGPDIYLRLPRHLPEKWRFRKVDGQIVEVACKTEKSLYGQHESGRQFSVMHGAWFTGCPAKPCLFHYEGEHGVVDVSVYVDACTGTFHCVETETHFTSLYSPVA